MLRQPLVSIIIPTHNNRDGLRKCVDSISAQTYKDFEVIIIFNACREIFQEFNSAYPFIKCVNSRENLFFSKAQNLGISLSGGEFILSLNDDCRLDKNFIEEALKPFYKNQNIGMVCGKVFRNDAKTIDTTGLFLSRSRRPIERGFNQIDRGKYALPSYVFGAPGCAALYKREMLENIKDRYGYFDSRFSMFYEDLDLSWRAKKGGYKCYFYPAAVAYHKRGQSAGKNKDIPFFARNFYFAQLPFSLQKALLRNRHITIFKNDTPAGFFINLAFIIGYDLKIYAYLFYILLRKKILKKLDKVI